MTQILRTSNKDLNRVAAWGAEDGAKGRYTFEEFCDEFPTFVAHIDEYSDAAVMWSAYLFDFVWAKKEADRRAVARIRSRRYAAKKREACRSLLSKFYSWCR
jgi:hypothetical protein